MCPDHEGTWRFTLPLLAAKQHYARTSHHSFLPLYQIQPKKCIMGSLDMLLPWFLIFHDLSNANWHFNVLSQSLAMICSQFQHVFSYFKAYKNTRALWVIMEKLDSTCPVLVLFEKSYKCRATLANRPDIAPTDSLHFQTRQSNLVSLRNVPQNHQTSHKIHLTTVSRG